MYGEACFNIGFLNLYNITTLADENSILDFIKILEKNRKIVYNNKCVSLKDLATP